MNRALQIVVGICVIVFGIVIYPYWITYIWNPIRDILDMLFPSMNVWQIAWFDAVPIGSLILILLIGTVWIMGKVGGHNRQEGDIE